MNGTPLLERGTPRSDRRKVWNSILYRLVPGCRWPGCRWPGCRWKDLPINPSRFIMFLDQQQWLKQLQEADVYDRVLRGLLQKGLATGKIARGQIAVDASFSPSPKRR
ncbi:MAG: transposase [Simkaniaceae bacterium]|nr:transposase [Simkaniaceae bacterium]